MLQKVMFLETSPPSQKRYLVFIDLLLFRIFLKIQDFKTSSQQIFFAAQFCMDICWLLPFGESHQSFQDFLTSSTKSSSSSTAKETSESQKWTLDESKIALAISCQIVKYKIVACRCAPRIFNYRRWGPWGPRIFVVLLEGVPRNAAFRMILRDKPCWNSLLEHPAGLIGVDSTWNPGWLIPLIWYTVDSCLIHINDVYIICVLCIYIYIYYFCTMLNSCTYDCSISYIIATYILLFYIMLYSIKLYDYIYTLDHCCTVLYYITAS